MCGIFGMVAPLLPSGGGLRNALNTLRHRGPDDEGYLLADTGAGRWLQASGDDTHPKLKEFYPDIAGVDTRSFNLVLGARRLSILDLSQRGHQPMGDPSGKLWISYNGEIFNFQALRLELESRGYRFYSGADTEVLLAAYDCWGPDVAGRLNGQWAFCIYDAKRSRLFCSRDRFGIKPFYYWYDETRFVFSSEIKLFFSLPFVSPALATELLWDFILYFRLEHTASSVYREIHQLLPGHNLLISLPDLVRQDQTYYEPPFSDEIGSYSHRRARHYADDIRELFIDSVKIRLQSDVPVGTCLSGGLDSSSITAVINRLIKMGGVDSRTIGERQHTFTASFGDAACDETPFADRVIRHTGVEGFRCHPTADGLWKEIDRFLYDQDGLCFGTNVYAGWKVMQLASQHVKVVLNGQGSDEIFGGYGRYDPLYFADLLRAGHWHEFIRLFQQKIRRYGSRYGFRHLLKDIAFVFTPRGLKRIRIRGKFAPERALLRLLLGCRADIGRMVDMFFRLPTSLNFQLAADQTRTYLPMLLRYDDRNASASSIENRVPFLDHRLVEYVNRIPAVYKMYNGWSKWLLRLAMKDFLPPEIIWRRDKNGFATPGRQWLLAPESPVPGLMKQFGQSRYRNSWWVAYTIHHMLACLSEHRAAVRKGPSETSNPGKPEHCPPPGAAMDRDNPVVRDL